jgi:hypothetical protein
MRSIAETESEGAIGLPAVLGAVLSTSAAALKLDWKWSGGLEPFFACFVFRVCLLVPSTESFSHFPIDGRTTRAIAEAI